MTSRNAKSAKDNAALKDGKARRWRGLVFRLAAVMLALMPFVLLEAAFTILDWGRPIYGDDPFVGFRAVHPLFVLDDDATRYSIPPSRQAFFRPDSFSADKAANEYRIFCLGGSTVQGRPFAIETSLTTWLEINLQAADPKQPWEVVNCGGVSYASYRLVPILEEVLGHQPDLVILYTGHNEFLEDRTYHHIKHMPHVVARPFELVAGTRTYTLLQRAYLRLCGRPVGAVSKDHPILSSETDAMLEYQGGLEQYHRDERWRRDVIEHFRYNLRRMVQMARDAGVPLLLVNPVCNIRDCPPFKAQHRDGLTTDELQQWKALIAEAAEAQSTNMYQAVTLLKEALAIDDQHAGLHFLMGKCYDAMGMVDEARSSYIQAKELDICPLRILEPMHEIVLEVARKSDTPVIDVRELFEKLCEEYTGVGIPGDYYMVDHVHPSVAGHRMIADLLADEMIRQGILHPTPDWKTEADRKAEGHLKSLDRLYFERGQERLESLRLWTRGKAMGVRSSPETTAP